MSQGKVQMLLQRDEPSKTEEVMTSGFVSDSIRMDVIDEASEIKKSECACLGRSEVVKYSVEASCTSLEEEVEE